VPSFAECSEEQARTFYSSRINPEPRTDYETSGDWRPMIPRQIADLATRGHSVGNHTLSHASLRGLSQDDLEREIGESARKISSWTGKPVDAFAWPFSWDAVNLGAWEVIRHYHRFCFAPCPGVVDSRVDVPTLIWRREIEVRYSLEELRFQYSGLVDLVWAVRRRRLRRLLRKSGDG
jgi:peptidoglycan/xylan/chitin deacetylase (PgdA/CDA1 family)